MEAIVLWDAATGKALKSLYGHNDRIGSMDASRGLLASASDDGSIRIWDTRLGREFAERSGRSQSIFAFPLSRDGRLLATSGPEGTISVWDAHAGTLLRNFPGLGEEVINAGDFSPDGSLLAVCNWEKAVKIWDVNTGAVVRDLAPMEGGSSGCAFSREDGRTLAAASTEKAVVLWDVETGAIKGRLNSRVLALNGDLQRRRRDDGRRQCRRISRPLGYRYR